MQGIVSAKLLIETWSKNKDRFSTDKANLKNIFVSPYPALFLWYGSVSRIFFFFNFSNSYPLNLVVNSPNIGNKTKYTNNAKLKIFYLKIYITVSVNIGLFSLFAMKFKQK